MKKNEHLKDRIQNADLSIYVEVHLFGSCLKPVIALSDNLQDLAKTFGRQFGESFPKLSLLLYWKLSETMFSESDSITVGMNNKRIQKTNKSNPKKSACTQTETRINDMVKIEPAVLNNLFSKLFQMCINLVQLKR